jgi:beta-phosphoglucomutase-like phosphatase (HAD superfamily)
VETHGESVFRYFFDERLDQAFEGADLIVFDMNGLIVNDEGVQLESVNRVLHPYSIHVAREYWINKCVGKRADRYLLQILSENGKIEDAHRVKSFVEEKNRWYEELIADNVTRLVRPGVRSLVEYISRRTAKILALATSALRRELEIIVGEKGLDLIRYFRFMLTGEDVNRSKPDPEVYERLLTLSRIPSYRCLVLEDSGPGVEASHAAGAACIAVPNEYTAKQDFSNASWVISDLTETARILYPIDLGSTL